MVLIMAMRRLLHVVSPLSLSSCSSSSSSCAAALAATRTPMRSKLCWQQPFLVATTKGQEVCASAGFFTESSSSSPAFFGGCSGVLAAKDSRVSGASFNKGERRRRRRGAEKRGFGNRSSSSSSSSVMGLGVQQERAVAVEEGMDPVQKRLMFEDECILVDEKDNVVGHDSKYNCHLMEKIEAENLLHRAFSVFLFNSKNELLLQKRSATKVTFPLVWTNTCCSHPLYRESELIQEGNLGVRNAAQRKLYDELGIVAEDAPVDEFTCLGRIHYKAASDGKWGEHELDYLLFLHRDVKVQPNPEEVADIQYVNREQLKEIIRKADAGEDGIKLSPWFRIVADNFLLDWWKRVDDGTLAEAADMTTIHKL
ncbi:unnamed protein product [Sphagnum jensenii]|uniref:isopentenyl-diphosphate Delta-isomerase n=1 Tax=Sphagnum jensenii TaxID=128206 RepID=A0ABP1A2Y9_9BRYO